VTDLQGFGNTGQSEAETPWHPLYSILKETEFFKKTQFLNRADIFKASEIEIAYSLK